MARSMLFEGKPNCQIISSLHSDSGLSEALFTIIVKASQLCQCQGALF